MKRLVYLFVLIVIMTVFPNIAFATSSVEPLENSGVCIEYNIPDDFRPYIDIAKSDDVLNYTFRFGQAQWEEIYKMTDGSDGGMFLVSPDIMNINFPSNAVSAFYDASGGYADDTEVIETLDMWLQQRGWRSSSNNEDAIVLEQSLHLAASISYSGTTAVIRPYNHLSTKHIAWMDEEGNKHYHKEWQAETHVDLTPVRIENAVPSPKNIMANQGQAPNVQWSLEEPHVLSYFITGSEPVDVATGIKAPTSNAVKAKVHNTSNIVHDDFDLSDGILSYELRFIGEYRAVSLGIEWIDASGNTVGFQRLKIQYNPISDGISIKEYFEPVPAISFNSTDGGQCFSYDNESGCILFTPDSNKLGSIYMNPVMDYIASIDIPIPAGAKFVNSSWQVTSLYTPIFSPPTNNLDPLIARNINDWRNEYLCFHNGELVSYITLPNGDSDYIATATPKHSIYQSWVSFYDEHYNLLKTASGKDGYFVYYMNDTASETIGFNATTPTELVTSPVAVYNGAANGDKLAIKAILNKQQNTDGLVFLLDIDYQNEFGYSMTPSDYVTIYLPYPQGMTYEQAQAYSFELFHYKNGLSESGEKLSVEKTRYGLKFVCNSFSPFLLIYKPANIVLPGGEAGASSLRTGTAPIINMPNKDTALSVVVNSNATMTIDATGADKYQWYVDRNDGNGFIPINSANASQYTVANASSDSDKHRFYCVASNEYGSTASPIFTLHVTTGLHPPKTGEISATASISLGLLLLLTVLTMCLKPRMKE